MKVKHFDFGVPAWFLALAFSSAGLLLSQAEEDWSRFRGPEGQGVSQVGGQPVSWSATENLHWRTELPGPGGSSPVVFSNRIYLTCYSGYAVPGTPGGDLSSLKRHIVCLAREDGKLLWVKDVPAAQPEQDKVRDHGYASSTPLADPNGVYVFFGKSGVLAF